MANIELPKDAEGREIPLDTKVPYGEDGKEFSVNYHTYSVRQTITRRKWQVVMMNCVVYDCSDLYIAPSDSWEKLLEDLKAVKDYGDSSHVDNPACHYMNMVGKLCDECKFYGGTNCVGKMCEDIMSRIHELRDECK